MSEPTIIEKIWAGFLPTIKEKGIPDTPYIRITFLERFIKEGLEVDGLTANDLPLFIAAQVELSRLQFECSPKSARYFEKGDYTP